MKRRGFFRFLAGAIAAVVAPSVKRAAFSWDVPGARGITGWDVTAEGFDAPPGYDLIFGYERSPSKSPPVPGEGQIQELRHFGGRAYAMRSGVWWAEGKARWEEVTDMPTLSHLYSVIGLDGQHIPSPPEMTQFLKEYQAYPSLEPVGFDPLGPKRGYWKMKNGVSMRRDFS